MKRLLLTFTKPSLFNTVYSQKKIVPLKNGRAGFDYFIGIAGSPVVVKVIKRDDKQQIGIYTRINYLFQET